MSSSGTQPNRNAPCPCGSGKRYKHCCGSAGLPSPPPTRSEALAAHRAGSLRLAESLYRRALEENPRDVDVLHMLGVVQLERLKYREALDLILDAAERTNWTLPQVRHNLGLVLAKLLVRGVDHRKTDLVEQFLAWEQSRSVAGVSDTPLVSVVMPAFNHERFVAQAVASVGAQTYPNIEFIAIDDGSTDGTAEILRKEIERLRIPVRFVARANRGAPATLNEGAALATGRYIAFLNSDDYFAPDRVAALVDGIARPGVAWGFSLVAQVTGDDGGALVDGAAPAGSYWQLQRSLLGSDSNSFALLQCNVAVSTGNLFVDREFFASVGGFRELRFNHDWDFCLRASALAEPMVVRRPLYFYRMHGSNTISESKARATAEADFVLGDVIANVLSGAAVCTNPLAPQWPGNRALLLTRILSAGQGALVPVPEMRKLAQEVRAGAPPAPSPDASAPPAVAQRTAVVVLGMHRSGTSAMARVLNLCGVFLPADLRAPNIYHNPTGFWEPEAIINLNERVLRQLGGAWHRVDFPLPDDAFADEFAHEVRALLAAEYGKQPIILIKDPRIAILAPLWHRALTAAGYRAVYVVPVRDPIEVARSLEARGDMNLAEGLALWASYMNRIAAFADTVPEVVHVRYTDLIDDWRAVVGDLADRLGLSLDPQGRADDIERFLEPSLRRQRSDEAALDALPDEPRHVELRALYRNLLSRSERKPRPTTAPLSLLPKDRVPMAPSPPRRTALIVLGMHRSGTSALARVLNLCGAFLPANLRPPKQRNNPKGSWEPEEIVGLNERVLRNLGGAWDHIDFELPDARFVDEFALDVRTLLTAEYGDQTTILIKDPRICVLAPLWHEALCRAGYRPAYAVPIRDPLEVAQSLNVRGDMTVTEGLALWLGYMQRIATFSDARTGVVFVRYTELIADWRGVVGRIGDRLGVALDVESRAGDVDRFVEPGLRRQRSDDAALDAMPDGRLSDDIRAMYRVCLRQCDEDASAPQASARHRPRVEIAEAYERAPLPTASFVLCIENNAIRDQAMMLCESIRQFGGNYRNAPIVAFSPRAGLAVDRETRRALSDLGVEYVDEPINTTCHDYPPANRVFAGAWAEARSSSDFIVVLDSDTVYLQEPEMPRDADVAVRPVDTKGTATRGPGDAFEDYWAALAAMCDISLDQLPYIRSTIEGERIRASYNGGLIVARRDKRVFTRGAELFSRSLAAGMRPYRGSGIDIFASTGPVGQAGSEYWGSSQAVLALAIWAATDRVVHFPGSYNLPLHLVASKGEIDPQWTVEPPVHVHYHYMFTPKRYETAMEILARIGVPADRMAWLAARIPFGESSEARQVA